MTTSTRELTGMELAILARGRGLLGRTFTCKGNVGTNCGPCGVPNDWTDGICRDGHEIVVVVDGDRQDEDR